MGFNTSLQQFVGRLNEIQLLPTIYSWGKFKQFKQLNRDEIIEILDQDKVPERNKAMFNVKIGLF
jgi:hypothetical protein